MHDMIILHWSSSQKKVPYTVSGCTFVFRWMGYPVDLVSCWHLPMIMLACLHGLIVQIAMASDAHCLTGWSRCIVYSGKYSIATTWIHGAMDSKVLAMSVYHVCTPISSSARTTSCAECMATRIVHCIGGEANKCAWEMYVLDAPLLISQHIQLQKPGFSVTVIHWCAWNQHAKCIEKTNLPVGRPVLAPGCPAMLSYGLTMVQGWCLSSRKHVCQSYLQIHTKLTDTLKAMRTKAYEGRNASFIQQFAHSPLFPLTLSMASIACMNGASS